LPEIEILVTAGYTSHIYNYSSFGKANDEVILDPSYDCYEAPILLCNAIPVRISLNDDYTTNWGIIENACSTTTAMIIINNPHNPTGKMLTQSDFEALESLLQKYPKLLSSLMIVYHF
jgi:methionine aminotransferase